MTQQKIGYGYKVNLFGKCLTDKSLSQSFERYIIQNTVAFLLNIFLYSVWSVINI